jgi:hypothetical protein
VNLHAVVLSWNGREDTLACLESLRGLPVVCVDNGSTDGSPEAVRERFPEVELVETGENLGYAAGNNVGVRRALVARADWVLLVNNDARVEEGIADALAAAAAARPDAGLLACKILNPDGTVQYAGARVGLWGHGRGRALDALADTQRADGAAMAVSRMAVERAGLLDEELFAYVEDVEWSLRIRGAGLGVVFVPAARVWHRGSASTGGPASPTALYYDTRNTIVVWERHRPLPRGLTALRRLVIVAAHLVQAAPRPARATAVLRGWRDARRGRLGGIGGASLVVGGRWSSLRQGRRERR